MTSFKELTSFAFVFTEKNKALPLWLLSILHGEQGKGLTRLIPGLIPWPSDLKHSKQTTSNRLIPNEKGSSSFAGPLCLVFWSSFRSVLQVTAVHLMYIAGRICFSPCPGHYSSLRHVCTSGLSPECPLSTVRH